MVLMTSSFRIPAGHSSAINTHIRKRFPFPLTPAQDKVVVEIARDLSSTVPTNRLIQGDVGSGKTAVAYLAAVTVAAGGHQVALMAPTELLAEQHARTLASLSQGSSAPIRIALLTASVPRFSYLLLTAFTPVRCSIE